MIVLDQYLELVRLSQLSIITNILTRQQQDMPVPAGVFCLGLSPQTCHQVEFINCDLSRALLLSRVRTSQGWVRDRRLERRLSSGRREMERARLVSHTRHHRERFISLPSQLHLTSRLSIIQMVALAGLKLDKLV